MVLSLEAGLRGEGNSGATGADRAAIFSYLSSGYGALGKGRPENSREVQKGQHPLQCP